MFNNFKKPFPFYQRGAFQKQLKLKCLAGNYNCNFEFSTIYKTFPPPTFDVWHEILNNNSDNWLKKIVSKR